MNEPIRVIAQTEDGPVDITEGVQALYDLVIQSMDWGSGFLTVEDALPVAHLAKILGYGSWQSAQDYVDAQIHSEAQQRFLITHRDLVQEALAIQQINTDEITRAMFPQLQHEHIFSPVGKCMWPKCKAIEMHSGDERLSQMLAAPGMKEAVAARRSEIHDAELSE